MKKTLINLAGYFFVSIFVLMLVWLGYDFIQTKRFPSKRSETEQRGNEITIALDKFKDDKGNYPKQLDELIPTYLTEIKKPVLWNKEWVYHHTQGESFELLVGRGRHNYPSLSYRRKGWYLDN